MATLNYDQRLINLQKRRFDGQLNESLLSKSFSDKYIPQNIKYIAELMKPISQKSTNKLIEAASRVETHLENGFNLSFKRSYRKQGSVMSNTHINASDFDFLAIIDNYNYVEPGLPITPPYEGVPGNDIAQLRKQAIGIMKDTYDEVDDSHDKCISIFNKALNRKVDIVFAFWYNTKKFTETGDEFYRGLKFNVIQQQPDYPFAHIKLVNNKGENTSDGSRKGIRLLKTLREDCEINLNTLKSFQLTSIVHSIENNLLTFAPGAEITIAQAVSDEMNKILANPDYRKSIKSPNGIERPLENDGLVKDITLLKRDLDTLIEDSTKEISKSSYLQKAILSY